ncbi:MAG: manganese efflux pump [Bacteroidales bacterium]|nr:manganese efflux pump [Bacteroidales bacterium]
MSWVELVFLAISLSFDTFAVSTSGGLCLKKCCPLSKRIEMVFSFAFFQAMFTLIGILMGEGFIELIGGFDHWIAFGLLVYLGGKMIKDAFSADDDASSSELDLTNRKTMVTMSVATSIDALAVGISLAMVEIQQVKLIGGLALIFGITALASWGGLRFGCFIGNRVGGRVSAVGGLILVIIGVKILLEHAQIF